jgi:hypothetical protein
VGGTILLNPVYSRLATGEMLTLLQFLNGIQTVSDHSENHLVTSAIRNQLHVQTFDELIQKRRVSGPWDSVNFDDYGFFYVQVACFKQRGIFCLS